MALLHDLKAETWPLATGIPGRRAEARLHRRLARQRFTPGMRRRIEVARLYADAVAALPATIDGQSPLPLPEVCPVTLDDLLSDGISR